jgi:hypothetical protein
MFFYWCFLLIWFWPYLYITNSFKLKVTHFKITRTFLLSCYNISKMNLLFQKTCLKCQNWQMYYNPGNAVCGKLLHRIKTFITSLLGITSLIYLLISGHSQICTGLTLLLARHPHEWNFVGGHVCKVTFEHLPKLLRSLIQTFRAIGQLKKIVFLVPSNII